MTRRTRRPLGRTQVLVLRLLANHRQAPSARDLAYDWPGLTESAVHGALNRLGDRGLVDLAGFDGRARTYKLTPRGIEAELELLGDGDEDDESAVSA